ncbi:MAG TPA: AtpZ/AtpI family protein [Candidatus Limnocylindrales bacterium]|nr:AtpZ/AtpI family protein [Candidatus Limnocylindrales bacterium]
MIEPGKGGAYLALFGEMGFALLVTTLIGALGGRWVDGQLGTLPIFSIVGFLAGAGAGARIMYQLVNRFLANIE